MLVYVMGLPQYAMYTVTTLTLNPSLLLSAKRLDKKPVSDNRSQ
jgi:hypothetical protein